MDKIQKKSFDLTQEFGYYIGTSKSGAYIFQPSENQLFLLSTTPETFVVKVKTYTLYFPI